MALSTGDKLGHYEIRGLLGKGGMGEVYRGRDTKLKREVALKVLPGVFARDPERMARFQREAEVLASLNHPNIAAIYGVESDGEHKALVMELVEGDAPKGPLPFDEAWAITSQIAAALEYAHEKNVIHRDLKPANVKVTPEGIVKLLDFGLAKALSNRREASVPTGEDSPTLTMGATEAGVILGTAAYMAPEQAKGKPLDKRADIWSFGVVLHELLSGQRLFKGEDIADTLAQVLTKEIDLSGVAPRARKLLRRCLERDPKNRLRDIGEARYLVEEVSATPEVVNVPAPAKPNLLWPAVAGVLLLLGGAAGYGWWSATRPVAKPLIQLSADLGSELAIGNSTGSAIAISPDGARIAFVSRDSKGLGRLLVRLLENTNVTELAVGEGATSPVFSPDSQWIAFFSGGKLKKVSVQGGSPVTLCDAPSPRGLSWGEDNNIWFELENRAVISRVSSNGGAPQAMTQFDAKKSEVTHRLPQLLPGGEAILFTASPDNNGYADATLEVQSLKTNERKTLVQHASFGRYLPSGHLVYLQEGTVFAAPMDVKRLELTGPGSPVIENVNSYQVRGYADLDITPSGTAVYIPGTVTSRRKSLFWVDSSGALQTLNAEPADFLDPRVSPDGTRISLMLADAGGIDNVAVFDPGARRITRLTFLKTSVQNSAVWAPDSKHLVFRSISKELSGPGLYWMRADGAGDPQRILEGGRWNPESISPDGKHLAYREGIDIWTLPLDMADPEHPKPGKPELFVHAEDTVRNVAFSPDGRWLAYSGANASNEVFVRPFPGPGGKWQISNGGGGLVMWSHNGRELFYTLPAGGLNVVDYRAQGDTFVAGQPRAWFQKPVTGLGGPDLAPDGKRFVVAMDADAGEQKTSTHAVFLFNFFDELRRRVK